MAVYSKLLLSGLEPTISCVRDRDSTTAPQETQLTEKTVKLILIHASVDSLNSLNSTISENSSPFRENPIIMFPFVKDMSEIACTNDPSQVMLNL